MHYEMLHKNDESLHHFAHGGICNIADAVIAKLKESFPDLELTRSRKACHYAFKDPFARHLTHRGVTMSVHVGKGWTGMDKSPHFSPRGEFETSDEEAALNYIKMVQCLTKLHALSERVAKIDVQKLADFLDSEEKRKENRVVFLEPALD